MVEVLLVLAAVGAGLVAVMRMDVSPRADDRVASHADRAGKHAGSSPEAGGESRPG